jgi:hypothetical protein
MAKEEIIKRQLEVLEETVSYYGADTNRRGIGIGRTVCEYLTVEEKMCAVGRCLTQSVLSKASMFTGGVRNLVEYIAEKPLHNENVDKFLDDIVKEEYRGLGVKFFIMLQNFHDGNKNWGKEMGLTPEGTMEVKRMKEVIKEGLFPDYGSSL